MSSSSWFSELIIDHDNLFPESDMSSGFSALDESAMKLVDELENDIQNSLSYERQTFTDDPTKHTDFSSVSPIETHQIGFDKPTKLLKTCDFYSSNVASQASLVETPKSPCVSSEEAEIPPGEPLEFYENPDYALMWKELEGVSEEQTTIPSLISTSPRNDENHAPPAAQPGAKESSEKSSRPPSRGREHVIAERNRRQKLNMQFIALSALLPGLRKTDKGSVLGEATKYLKQLQHRVNLLEAQIKEQSKNPVVTINETRVSADDDFSSHSKRARPHIEAEVSEKNVLIRIHVEKREQCLTKILATIEKLHLNVISSSVLPFGKSTVVITLVGQMDTEFHMSVKDLQTNLLSAVLKANGVS